MASQQDFFWVATKRGKCPVLDGFRFRYSYPKNGKKYWRCIVDGCTSSIITNASNETLVRGIEKEHGHEIDYEDLTRKIVIEKAKAGVRMDPVKPNSRILADATASVLENLPACIPEDEARAAFPELKSVKHAMSNERLIYIPAQPKHRRDVNITGMWTKTQDGREFHLTDDGQDDKIVLFATQEFLKYMSQAEVVYMDGTFYTVPSIFNQLYTIHCFIKGEMFPIVYALMPDRKKDTYIRLFSLIMEACEEIGVSFNPEYFHVDFEVSVIQAIKDCFPESNIRGCYFHFTQAVFRKFQEHGLQRYYREPGVRKLCHRLCALPLVRGRDTGTVYNLIKAQRPQGTEYAEAVDKVLRYYERTWLNSNVFRKEMWNHFNNRGPRTTNHVEGWHNRFKQRVEKCHPSLYEFIVALRKEQKANDDRHQQLLDGKAPKQPKELYKKISQKLTDLRTRTMANEMTWIEFLDAAGYQLKIKN